MFQTIVQACRSTFWISSSILLYTGLALLMFALLQLFAIYIKTYLFINKLYRKKEEISDTGLEEIIYKYDLQDKVIVVSDSKPFAFCLGIKDPHIYVSTTLIQTLNKKELEAVLLHEKYHLLNNDNVSRIFFSFIKTLFIFFPLVSEALNHLQLQSEIKADTMASSVLKNKGRVVSALRKVLDYQTVQLAYTSSFTHAYTLEQRIRKLTKNEVSKLAISVKGVAITTVSFLVLLMIPFIPFHEVKAHTHTEQTCGNNVCQLHCITDNRSSLPLTPNRNVSSSR